MADENTSGQASGGAGAQAGLLDQILNNPRMRVQPEPEAEGPSYPIQLLDEFTSEVLTDDVADDRDVVTLIEQRIAEIDEKIGLQLDEILHAEEFQQLEATWRGLHYLVMNTETGTMLKLRVLNTNKKDLAEDLEKAIEFDQSGLFKMVYESEYGTFGGTPYGCLVADYYFDKSTPDMKLLQALSGVAAAAHAPLLSAASPGLFDFETWLELPKKRDLAKIFESLQHVAWRAFRDSEDSRYVVLTAPRFMLRAPYDPIENPVEDIVYKEQVHFNPAPETNGSGEPVGPRTPEKQALLDQRAEQAAQMSREDIAITEHGNFLWGNSAYTLAQRITNAFALHKWMAAIRGVEGGGLVEGLPLYFFTTDEGDVAIKCPTEVGITDRREKELNDLGFIALVHRKNGNQAAFFGGHSTQKPKVYDTAFANANARLSAMLPYMLCTSRFAHYIKSIMRDKVGSFMTAQNVAEYLNRWISNYVLLDDSAPQAMKAKYPLREARVDVVDEPGKPGCYKATVFLRPHFQLEELTVSMRLVAELPPPAA